MTPEQWQRLDGLLDSLLDLPAAQREGWLARQAPGLDADDRQRLRALLARAEADTALDHGATAEIASGRLLPAQSVGGWQIESSLGAGGQGQTYRVRRELGGALQRGVLKLPHAADADSLRRSLRERRLLAGLQHPSIPGLLDGGLLDDGRPWWVLAAVDGDPIDRHVQSRRLAAAAIVDLLMPLADALGHAHGRLVLHRDLKPDNVLVDRSGRPQLLDFGIGRALDETGTLTTAGFTASYAAPEQIRGGAIGVAVDVHGYGALLYRLLAGKAPFAADTLDASLHAVLHRDPPPVAGLDRELQAILGKALRKEPAERYASIAELAEDLQRWRQQRPVRALQGGRRYVVGKFLRRQRTAVAVGSLIVLLLAGSAAFSLRQAAQSEAARVQADATRADAERAAQRALSINDLFNEALVELGRLDRSGEAVAPRALLDFVEARAEQPRFLPDARVDIINQLALLHENAGRPERAMELFDQSLALIESLPPDQREPNFEIAAWRGRSTALRWLQRPEEALQATERALALLAEQDEASAISELSTLQDQRASLLYDAGRVEEGLAQRRATLGLVDRHGAAAQQRLFYAASNFGADLARAGYEDQAIALLRQRIAEMDPALAAAFPHGPAILKVQLGRALRLRGESAEALDWYRRGITLREQHHDPRHFTFLHGRAERWIFELEAGRPANEVLFALRELLAAFDEAGHSQQLTRGMLQAWRARAATLAGEAEEARSALQEAISALRRLPEGQRNQLMGWLQVLQAAEGIADTPLLRTALVELRDVLQRFHDPRHPLRLTVDILEQRLTDEAPPQAACAALRQRLQAGHSYLALACG